MSTDCSSVISDVHSDVQKLEYEEYCYKHP